MIICACEAPAAPANAAFKPEIADTLQKKIIRNIDTTVPAPPLKPYNALVFFKKETLASAPGTKSVLFNSKGSKLYAMNLEGMSIYEFDQTTKKVVREFKFKPTRGTGWDYANDKPVPSWQEKPVEACFSHGDKFLWVSLHNAGGIVPIRVDGFEIHKQENLAQDFKQIKIVDLLKHTVDSFKVPLIKTGATPKVISKTADNKYLLVSNWHSYTVSVLELDSTKAPYGKVISTIPVTAIPRGIAVDDKNNKSYVAIMGGANLTVINNWVWQKEDDVAVASNPRHVVIDTSGRLFVSYNKLAKVACINATTGKTLFTATTAAQPRTIILSKNQQFLFVTCYNGNAVDVFKINKDSFDKIYSLECKGKPVGVDIYENDDVLEAWVCTYTNGAINVFSFQKK